MYISKKEKQQILDILNQGTTDTIIKNEQFIELKNAATAFLQSIEGFSAIAKHTDLVKRMEATKDLITMLYSDMKGSSEITQRMLEAQHTFEKVLNKYLNRSIHLTYVNSDGSLVAYDDVTIGLIYSKATGNTGRGNIKGSDLKGINPSVEIQEINNLLKKNSKTRDMVYTTAIERWQASKNKSTKAQKTFWWIVNDNFGRSQKISSAGVIAEGYAEAVINNHKSIINANIEQSLANLNDIIKKDSIPAAVKGDIAMNGSNIQFAVKMGNFSSAKIGQYIRLAYNIERLNDNILEQHFRNALPKLLNLSTTADKYVEIMNNEVEKVIQEDIIQSIKS